MKLKIPKPGKGYRTFILIAILSLLSLILQEWPDFKRGWTDGAADAFTQKALKHRK